MTVKNCCMQQSLGNFTLCFLFVCWFVCCIFILLSRESEGDATVRTNLYPHSSFW